jgi:hypothetical protein
MDFISTRPMLAIALMAAFILLVAVVRQYENRKEVLKAYNKKYAHAQVEVMARARNELLTRLKLANRLQSPVSLMTLVKEVEESMNIIHILDIMPGDFVRPHVRFMTYQDEVLFIFGSRDSDVEVELRYPKSQYLLP